MDPFGIITGSLRATYGLIIFGINLKSCPDEVRRALELVRNLNADLQALITLRNDDCCSSQATTPTDLARIDGIIKNAQDGLKEVCVIVEKLRPEANGGKVPLRGRLAWTFLNSHEFNSQEPLISRQHSSVLAELNFLRMVMITTPRPTTNIGPKAGFPRSKSTTFDNVVLLDDMLGGRKAGEEFHRLRANSLSSPGIADDRTVPNTIPAPETPCPPYSRSSAVQISQSCCSQQGQTPQVCLHRANTTSFGLSHAASDTSRREGSTSSIATLPTSFRVDVNPTLSLIPNITLQPATSEAQYATAKSTQPGRLRVQSNISHAPDSMLPILPTLSPIVPMNSEILSQDWLFDVPDETHSMYLPAACLVHPSAGARPHENQVDADLQTPLAPSGEQDLLPTRSTRDNIYGLALAAHRTSLIHSDHGTHPWLRITDEVSASFPVEAQKVIYELPVDSDPQLLCQPQERTHLANGPQVKVVTLDQPSSVTEPRGESTSLATAQRTAMNHPDYLWPFPFASTLVQSPGSSPTATPAHLSSTNKGHHTSKEIVHAALWQTAPYPDGRVRGTVKQPAELI